MGKRRKSSAHPPKANHPWLHRSHGKRTNKSQLLAQVLYLRREKALIDYLLRAKYMSGIA